MRRFAPLVVLIALGSCRAEGPARPVVHLRINQADPSALTVQWLGDTMLGDAAQPLLDKNGYDWPLAAVAPLLSADVIVANSETPLTRTNAKWGTEKPYSYQSDPASAPALARAGINVVGLANNHAMDRGPVGLKDTLDAFHNASVATVGAGMDLEKALRPVLIHGRDRTVGIVAFGENFGVSSRATEQSPGIAVMTRDTIDQGYQRAKLAGADYVVAFVHWGDNYEDLNDAQRRAVRRFARAGYRLVIGAGSHIVHPIDVIDGMPVVYSLGNFVFGSGGRFEKFGKRGNGLAVTTQFHKDGSVTAAIRCINTDNKKVEFAPTPCSPDEARRVLPQLNPGIVMRGDVGYIRFPASEFPPRISPTRGQASPLPPVR